MSRADHRRSWRFASDGGWCFPFDPSRPVTEEPALWAPEVAHMVVAVRPVSDGPDAASGFDLAALPLPVVDRATSDWRYLILPGRIGALRIWIDEPSTAGAFAIVLGTGDDALLRSAAVHELISAMTRSRHRPSPCLRPRANERRLLAMMLAILDAIDAGRRPREIARTLVYPKLEKLRGPAWTGSPERRQTYRLIRRAIAIRDGGYRALLAGRMPKA